MAHDITIGSTVARKSKGSKGRTGQVIEIQANHARVHWTRKADGNLMNQKSWVFVDDLTELSKNKAIASVFKKMSYIIEEIERGPLAAEEYQALLNILGRVKSDNVWAVGIHLYMQGPREHDHEFIAGLAEQCMDDIFTMTCIVGQEAVMLLLRTVKF